MIPWSPPFIVVVLGQLMALGVIAFAIILAWRAGESTKPAKQKRQFRRKQIAHQLNKPPTIGSHATTNRLREF